MRKVLAAGVLAAASLACAAEAATTFQDINLDVGGGEFASARFYRDDTWASARPTVFLLHGCSGMWSNSNPFPVANNAAAAPVVASAMQAWIDDILAEGWNVMVIDSFTNRYAADLGIPVPVDPSTLTLAQRDQFKGKNECNNGGGVGISEVLDRPLDVAAAVQRLANQHQHQADGSLQAVLGWSHGASTTMAVLSAVEPDGVTASPNATARRFKAGVAWYPGCGLNVPSGNSVSAAYGGIGKSKWRPYTWFQMFHATEDRLYDRSNEPNYTPSPSKPQFPCTKRMDNAEPLIEAAAQTPNVDWDAEADLLALLPDLIDLTVYEGAQHGFDSNGNLISGYPNPAQCDLQQPGFTADACAYQQSRARAMDILKAALN